MSVHASAYVWEHSTHKGAELLLMLAIADIAHRNGYAFPSVATLARYIRMSERNTQRLIQKCEASGELRIKRQGGPHGTHAFMIVMNTTLPLFLPGDNLSPDKLSGDRTVEKGVTKHPIRGDSAMSPEPTEPKTERKEGAARRTSLPVGFTTSDKVKAWAKAKGWERYLPAHLEHFLGHCRANPARYVDWDEALMNCIRADWGGVRRMAQGAERRGERPTELEAGMWWTTDKGIREQGEGAGIHPEGGEPWTRYTARVFSAAGDGPWIGKASPLVRMAMEDLRRESEGAGA